MRRIIWYAGGQYYRIVPILVVTFMLTILAITLVGFYNAMFAMGLEGFVVVIDPGHGGYDPGAITKLGIYEKDINLAIGKKLESQLELTGAKVIMTRENDRDYVAEGIPDTTKKRTDLNYRIRLAETAKANVIISIHVNAGSRKSGAETFYQEGSAAGKELAENIQNELRKIPGMNKRVAKSGQFYLTKQTSITAVIVEVGYLSNPTERIKLQQEEYQTQLARAIAQGVNIYLSGKK